MSEVLLNSQALILGLIVPLAILMLYLRKKRNSAVRRRLQLKAEREKVFRWAFPALILALLWLAYLRPFAGFEEISTTVEGSDILAVVDVSNSMYAKDVSPNRLEFVKRKLHDLVRIIRERKSGERIGLILFAGKAYLFCPLTQDYSVFLEFVEAIGGDQIVAGGSQIEEALSLASRVFESVKTSRGLMLLFSDGEKGPEPQGTIFAGTPLAEIVLLGVGTPQGSPIEVGAGRVVRDATGKAVISRRDDARLRDLAERIGALFLPAVFDDSDLLTVLQRTRSEGKRGEEERLREYNELGPYIALGTLLIFVLLSVQGRLRWVFPLFVLVLGEHFLESVAQGEEAAPPPPLSEAWRLYSEGEYEGALSGFEAALAQDPDNMRIAQALGSALFKLGRFKEAEKYFSSVTESASTKRQRFEGLYNRGNAKLAEEKFDAAISDYQEALEVYPDEVRALHNLEVARQKKKQQKSSSSSSSSQSSSPNSSETSSRSESSSSDSRSEESSEGSSTQNSSQADSEAQEGHDSSPSSEQSSRSLEDGSGSSSSSSEGGQEQSSSSRSASEGSPGTEEKAEGDESEKEAFSPPPGQTQDESQLKKEEAEEWLRSLPQAPLLPRGSRDRRRQQDLDTW